MSRWPLLLSQHSLDAAVLLAAIWSAAGTATRRNDVPMGASRSIFVIAVAAIVLVLLLRRRFPFVAPAAMWLMSTALSFEAPRLVTHQSGLFLAGLGGAVLLGSLRTGAQAWAGLVLVLVGAATIVTNDPTRQPGELVSTPLLFGMGWLFGYALRDRTERSEVAQERATRAEQERESAARVAVAEERARIARELHDVVAHAVSVMVLQVGAVRHRMPDTDNDTREALINVERAGRSALVEMRRLLGAMRDEGDQAEREPRPGLDTLQGVLDETRSAGLACQLQIHGAPFPLPPSLDLSAYRVVQEALTNTLKHAGAREAQVSVHYRPDEVCVEVRDDGRGPSASDGLGHGLVGMAERVKIYGGELSAGGAPGGGFRVSARFPVDGAS